MATAKELTLHIPAPKIETIRVTITGDGKLIFHRWTEKAKKQIRDKQQKKANKGREIRDPEAEFKDSFYKDKDGDIAFPALALKLAMVSAARSVAGATMTALRGSIFVAGDADGLIKVLVNGKPASLSGAVEYFPDEDQRNGLFAKDSKNPDIKMREDSVVVGMGSADLRYRGSVTNWSMVVDIRYNADVISAEQTINLLQIAGFGCGLGEWRPEKSGESGTFSVAT